MPPIRDLTICLKDRGTERERISEKSEDSDGVFHAAICAISIQPLEREKETRAVNRSNPLEKVVPNVSAKINYHLLAV